MLLYQCQPGFRSYPLKRYCSVNFFGNRTKRFMGLYYMELSHPQGVYGYFGGERIGVERIVDADLV